MATTLMPELPREFLAAARKGQEYALDAIRTWAQTVQSAIPELRTPQFPFADRLPKPETVLANAYDFAGQLLASQRHFAEELLKATEPLMPAIGRHAPDATDARQTPATHTARTAPRTPAAHTARTAPRTPAAHTARTAPRTPAAHTPATPTAAARTAPEAPAAHAAAASTPRTTRTAPKASATSTTSTTRTAPQAAASRRQTTPKAGS